MARSRSKVVDTRTVTSDNITFIELTPAHVQVMREEARRVRAHLIEVFRPEYGKDAGKTIDQICDHMGRNFTRTHYSGMTLLQAQRHAARMRAQVEKRR